MNTLNKLSTLNIIIILGFMIVLLISTSGLIGYFSIEKVLSNLNTKYYNDFLSLQYLNLARVNVRANEANLLHLIFAKDQITQQKLIDEINERTVKTQNLQSDFEKIHLNYLEKKTYHSLKNDLISYRVIRNNIIQIADNKNIEELYKQYLIIDPIIDRINRNYIILINYHNKETKAVDKKIRNYVNFAKSMILITLLSSIILLFGLGLIILRLINKKIYNIQEIEHAISKSIDEKSKIINLLKKEINPEKEI